MPASFALPIRIAILTDNRLLDEGLRHIIGSDSSLALVGKPDNTASRPSGDSDSADIMLADARSPSSLAVGTGPRGADARPWLIWLGVEEDERWTLKVLKAGARGILGKDAGVEDLKDAIRVVHEGQIWMHRKVLTRLIGELVSLVRTPPPAKQRPPGRLSARADEIVRLVADGLGNEMIAERLGISEATVKAHLTGIFRKLGVRNRGQLAAHYYRTLVGSPRDKRLSQRAPLSLSMNR